MQTPSMDLARTANRYGRNLPSASATMLVSRQYVNRVRSYPLNAGNGRQEQSFPALSGGAMPVAAAPDAPHVSPDVPLARQGKSPQAGLLPALPTPRSRPVSHGSFNPLPSCPIRDLAALVRIENAERGLRWMWTQKDKQKTLGTADMANLLRNVARRHVNVDEQHQRHLDKWNDNFAVRQPSGMTAKNRDRLRPLEDPDTLRRLLTLPDRLFERGVRGGDSLTTALEREDAIALAILIYCPIRRKNLFGIHLEHNLQRMGDGRAFLVFEAGEVKNRRRIEFALPSHVVTMIDAHLKSRCPRLCPSGTPWLFAQRDGTAAGNTNYLCTKLKRRIAREIGLTINPHLFRHIAAKIFLEAHPGQYEIVKRLLGHTALSQTLNAYAGFEAGSSVRLFAAVVEKARRT